jgi:hypothetical protein
MENEEAFNIWKSKVEMHLESMVKKTISELTYYNYKRDFNNNVAPQDTATRVIQKTYQKA